LIASAEVPDEIRGFLFGGRLLALEKKGGGIRPIAVGVTWRRLTSKLVNAALTSVAMDHIHPYQLGVGVPGGAEAAISAARQFLDSSPNNVLLKLDFTNAFNTIRRDCILESVADISPEWYRYVKSSYEGSSSLFYEGNIVESAEGVQQGDPLGPLLFCIVIRHILASCASAIRLGYLDDLTLGGAPDTVSKDLELVRSTLPLLGLSLNDAKCEVIVSRDIRSLPTNLLNLPSVPATEAVLLGVPLLCDTGLDQVLAEKVRTLSVLCDRLQHLESHDALTILRHSIALPSMQHLLRGVNCYNHPALSDFDIKLRSSLSAILNVNLPDDAWSQATLPVKLGGLGIRRTNQVAPSAYLAASHKSEELVSSLLLGSGASYLDSARQQAYAGWVNEGGATEPVGEAVKIQREWDAAVVREVAENLLNSASNEHTVARLRASCSPHSGDWLSAPPLTAAGLRMSNEVVRIAAGLRLGVQLCGHHTCQCGEAVSTLGTHGLSCKFSSGRIPRHTTVNDLLFRSINRAGLSAVKEPDGLVPGSSLRPDGVTLIPWSRGRCLAWDFTSPDTLATSHLPHTSTMAGTAAERAARIKEQKYSSLASTHIFIPVAVETFGSWNAEGLGLVRELGKRLTVITGDPRETAFLLQRISVAVQRGNAAAVLGSLPGRT